METDDLIEVLDGYRSGRLPHDDALFTLWGSLRDAPPETVETTLAPLRVTGDAVITGLLSDLDNRLRSRSAILSRIDEAFQPDRWPTPEPVVLGPEHDEETRDAVRLGHGRWDELFRSGAFETLQWTIPLLPESMFVSLLPGFLKLVLVDSRVDWLWVVNTIAPPWPAGTPPVLLTDLGRLDLAQRQTVVRFLDWLTETEEKKPNVRRRVEAIRAALATGDAATPDRRGG